MAVVANTYQQTDTAPTCGNAAVTAGCTGRSASSGTTDSISASVGGSAGSVQITTGIQASGTNVVFFEIDCGPLPTGYVSVAAQTIDVPINVTGTNTNLTVTEVYVCRVSSACASIETVGSVTGLSSAFGGTGTYTFHPVVAAKKVFYSTDRLVFFFVGTNGSSMSEQSIQVTPSLSFPISLHEGVQSNLTTFTTETRASSLSNSDWGTEGNAATSNDTRATHTHGAPNPQDGFTGWLQGAELATKLGGTKVPGDVYLWVERRNSGDDAVTVTVKDSSLLMLAGGSQVGADKADTSTAWPAADGRVKYTWTSPGLTQTQIDATDFLFKLSAVQDEDIILGDAVPEVDAMQVTIETDALAIAPGTLALMGVGI